MRLLHACQRRKNGATPLDLATDDTCRDILEHHQAIFALVTEDPTILVTALLALCATHSDFEEPGPSSALSLRAHHFNPAFLWAPTAARSAVIAWALHVFIAQLAATIQLFEDLPDDCAGDVLEFFGMTHKESERIAKHCSSPEAHAWVCAVIAAAVVVGAARCSYNKECTVSVAFRILQTLILYPPLWFFPLVTFRKRQRLSYCPQLKMAIWRPSRTAFQRRLTLRLQWCVPSFL